jgi:hypothetical protein
MNRAVVTLLAAALLTACGSTSVPIATGPPAPSPSASGMPVTSPAVEATPSPVSSHAVYPTPVPSATPTLNTDSIGEVIVTDLVVRSAPGVGADSRILEQRLTEADLVYVIDGPVRADGYDWLLVAELATWDGLGSPVQGWVAPASRDGEPWVLPTEPACPTEVSVDVLAEVPLPLRLYCFGGQEVVLEGALGFCGHGDPVIQEPAWLANYQCIFDALGRPAGSMERPLLVHVPPDSGVPSWDGTPRPLRITGRFDHPAAQTCRFVEGAELTMPDLEIELAGPLLRFQCRTGLVLQTARPIDG